MRPAVYSKPALALILLCLAAPAALRGQAGLAGIRSWAFQLQQIDIGEIEANTGFDLIVIDYSADGGPEAAFTAGEIQRLKNSGKTVLAYLSIGEAETYRFYWKAEWDADGNGRPDPGAPAWLGRENEDWEGNYKVRFWDPDWQKIIFTYLDTLISRGYDGAYLDIVDAYYYWSEEEGSRPDADSLMIGFVRALRARAADADGRFFLVPQNGEYIIEERHVTQALRDEYLGLIDAVGAEDLFFYGSRDMDNSWDPDEERIYLLEEYLAAGLPVFSVEYLTAPASVSRYVQAALAHGFIPYAADRDLDTLRDGLTVVTCATQKTDLPPLLGNYPNPFNSSTQIEFFLSGPGRVRFDVFSLRGERVRTITTGHLAAGRQTITVSAEHMPSGVYCYTARLNGRLGSGTFIITK